jgi:hypothetical protein
VRHHVGSSVVATTTGSTAVVDIWLWEEDIRAATAVHLTPLIGACCSWSLGGPKAT